MYIASGVTRPGRVATASLNPASAITSENGSRATLVLSGGRFFFGSPHAVPPWGRRAVIATDKQLLAVAPGSAAHGPSRCQRRRIFVPRAQDRVSRGEARAVRRGGPERRAAASAEYGSGTVPRARDLEAQSRPDDLVPWRYSHRIARRIFTSKTCHGVKGHGGYCEA
jgi:hypothetical protein